MNLDFKSCGLMVLDYGHYRTMYVYCENDGATDLDCENHIVLNLSYSNYVAIYLVYGKYVAITWTTKTVLEKLWSDVPQRRELSTG